MTLAFERKTIICIIICTIICIHFQLILAAKHVVKHLVPKKTNTTSLRIYHGQPVQLGEVPYQVAFKTRIQDVYITFCGGSIIGTKKLLSAAHCFVSEETGLCGSGRMVPLHNRYAVAATVRNYEYVNEINALSQWRRLKNVIYPENYNFPENDIAVVFVTKPFKFNEYVKPINLADKFIDYSGACLASGYGRISHDILSDSLLKTYLELFPERWCSLQHNRDMTKFVCTSLIEADIGQGDSGGPLVCSHTGDPVEEDGGLLLVGVACGTYETVNSIFSRVSKFRDFIIDSNSCIKSTDASIYFVFVVFLSRFL